MSTYKLAAIALIAAFWFPGVSFAQSTPSVATLQSEIQVLLVQVQQLQAQLAIQDGSSPMWCHTFSTNLEVGSSGADVTALQTALQKDGGLINVTGTFDDQTASAVTGFQEKYASQVLTPNGLRNGTGYAGQSTRAELNALFGCVEPVAILPPSTSPASLTAPSPSNSASVAPNVESTSGQLLTVATDPNTPTGIIGKDQGQVLLAKFDLAAGGEAVLVKYLTFKLNFTGGTITSTVTLNNAVKNIAITDDQANQVGTTINNPPTGYSCDMNGASIISGVPSTDLYVDCEGTSASPVIYIVPANSTRVLSFKADIQSTASFSTVTVNLTGNSQNLQGLTSAEMGSSGSATGATLTLAN